MFKGKLLDYSSDAWLLFLFITRDLNCGVSGHCRGLSDCTPNEFCRVGSMHGVVVSKTLF